MVQRRSATPPGSKGGAYKIGYRKPPVHSRFRPGQSGNPRGRRKGVRNIKTDVKRTLRMPLTVTEGGRKRKRSTQEAALMVLREKALRGDTRALNSLIELALRFNNDSTDTQQARALGADDKAILAAFVTEHAAATALPAGKSKIVRRRLKRKKS